MRNKAKKIEPGKILLPDGEVVKVRKKYCDKRKDEKYISKRLNELNQPVKKKERKLKVDKGERIPLRVDEKTIVYVWEYLCYRDKWLLLIGSKEKMTEHINKFKTKELKLWQI